MNSELLYVEKQRFYHNPMGTALLAWSLIGIVFAFSVVVSRGPNTMFVGLLLFFLMLALSCTVSPVKIQIQNDSLIVFFLRRRQRIAFSDIQHMDIEPLNVFRRLTFAFTQNRASKSIEFSGPILVKFNLESGENFGFSTRHWARLESALRAKAVTIKESTM